MKRVDYPATLKTKQEAWASLRRVRFAVPTLLMIAHTRSRKLNLTSLEKIRLIEGQSKRRVVETRQRVLLERQLTKCRRLGTNQRESQKTLLRSQRDEAGYVTDKLPPVNLLIAAFLSKIGHWTPVY
jgi:hypothetical protein